MHYIKNSLFFVWKALLSHNTLKYIGAALIHWQQQMAQVSGTNHVRAVLKGEVKKIQQQTTKSFQKQIFTEKTL